MKVSVKTYIALVLFLLLGCSSRNQQDNLLVLDGSTMGTFYSVKIVREDLQPIPFIVDTLKSKVDSLLLTVNQQMSTYLEDSEISRFNQYQGTDWFPVSEDLAYVVKNALQVSRLSHGTFDVTVGPLVNLWGFGPENRPTLIPSKEEIIARMKLTGYQHLSVRMDPPALKKSVSGIYVDLSAIAKGFGVDKVTSFLESLGIHNFIVDIGGEISTRGTNYQGKIWKIGVSTPDEKMGIQKVIPLENECVATSGDYRNYFEKNGVRYSHTIDPRTGKPITHKLSSVTVVYDTCMIADAFATAIDVMGPQQGYQFAREQELAVFLIVRDTQGFKEETTPQFSEILEVKNKEIKQ
jgi:thiamine biosynthesis lipoprotein